MPVWQQGEGTARLKWRKATGAWPAGLPFAIPSVEDGHGKNDLLHLIVEIKGYRREDAKEKKATMDTYWVPGVNNLGSYGRWAFAEFTEVYRIETDFEAKVEAEFNKMIEQFSGVWEGSA